MEETEYLLHRRFDRMGRLVGDTKMEKLFKTHVMIIGLGGVGGWAAESLVRSGVGQVTLVDFDEVCITNTNRQIQAMSGTIGKKKAELLKERLEKINPQAKINAQVVFYNEENSEQLLGLKPDFIIDAIDNLTAKCHLIASSVKNNLKIITCGGAGAKLDPSKIQLTDLAETHTDPLVQTLRKLLRQKYAFPREGEGKFGVPCVFSTEEIILPKDLTYDKGLGFKCVCPHGANNLHSCERRNVIYGSASFITGSFGFFMTSWVINFIFAEQEKV
jgi:tRNA A37 threonylcarbamoyladenosine dehydratase